MPRIASLSSHGPRGCTLRVTLTALLRLRLESRQIRADSGRSCRVFPERFSAQGQRARQFCERLRAAEKSAALLFGRQRPFRSAPDFCGKSIHRIPQTSFCVARTERYCLKQYRLNSTDTPRLTPRGNSLLRGNRCFPGFCWPARPAQQRMEIATCLD